MEMRRNVSLRAVILWNSLPQKALEAGSSNACMAELTRFSIDKGVEIYGDRQEGGFETTIRSAMILIK